MGAALDRARHEAHTRELALVTAEKDLQKAESQPPRDRRASRGAWRSKMRSSTRALDEAGAERDEAAARARRRREARVEIAEGELHDAEAALGEARERLDGQRQLVTARKVATAATREKLAAARGTGAPLGPERRGARRTGPHGSTRSS